MKKLLGILAAVTLFVLPLAGTAGAHGTGVVKSCVQGTDCTNNSSNNAVFAICSPLSASTTCNPGRNVTIQLSNFGSTATVEVYFLNHEVDNPQATDCSQAVGKLGRTHLGQVTTGTNGKGSLNVTLPPGGGSPAKWSYGVNWICATSDPNNLGTGVIGDQQFAIYPI